MSNSDNEKRNAQLTGDGAISQSSGDALGAGAVKVGGDIAGDVVTGTKIVIYQGREVSIPAPEAIAAHRKALRVRLERAALERWGGMGVYIREEGASLPIQASPYEQGALGPRADLLDTLKAADRLLVLGEPGAGKTVALERLAWELCNGNAPTVPVLVRLFHYAGTPLQDWVRATLQATAHLRLDDDSALAAFLKAGDDARCTFLFDGLNEVPPPYRDRLQDELVRWMAAYPRHPVILTSRAQDELWRRLRDTVGQTMVVQPIADAQAQDYLEAHLQEKGRDLHAHLDERLRVMARTPLILWLIKEAGQQGESVPGNRGELYERFVSRMLRRDTERRMDAAIPERRKRDTLSALAYHLSVEQRLTCAREEAEAVAARVLADAAEARTVIDACARHGLLAGDENVWFAPHQTVQEYFAAQALLAHWQKEQQQPGLRRWWGRARRQSILHLARDDWWAEPFVQMAGLVDATDTLARGLARENPWLAWWCVEEGRGVSEETRTVVETRSTKLLQSSNVTDRRRAVTALAQMKNERIAEPLIRAAGDDDAEVAQLAIRALGDLGKAIWPQILAAAQNRELWKGMVRYVMAYPDPTLCARVPMRALEELLGFPVMWVPAGPFLMGSDKTRDPQAYDNELPQHEVTLPDYWIAKMPVTVAQFREFAAEYRWTDQRSLQGPGDHPTVRMTWHDALAYCRWLRGKTGLPVTLPSEAEWEKAARGTDGRLYPWGDEPPDNSRCNFADNERGKTPVGRYSPRGDSPYGCVDMAGNVMELTRSHWKDYPYQTNNGREDLTAGDDVRRAIRGGTFQSSDARYVRCAFRRGSYPGRHLYVVGFRVVVSPSA